MNFDESILLIELTRKLTIQLISISQTLRNDQEEIKNITTHLLGLILTMPRMNEASSENSSDIISKAVKQIDQLTKTTSKIQAYLIEKIEILKNYLL